MLNLPVKPRNKRERLLNVQAYERGWAVGKQCATNSERIEREERAKVTNEMKEIAICRARLDGVPQLAKALFELAIAAGVPQYTGRK